MPWNVIGGSPLSSEVAAKQLASSTTYTNLTTPGPFITAPLQGDYDIEISSTIFSENQVTIFMSYMVGATAATDADALQEGFDQEGVASAARTKRRLAVPAGTLFIALYRTSNGKAAEWSNRFIRLMPIRVG